MTALFGNMFTI